MKSEALPGCFRNARRATGLLDGETRADALREDDS
jgi:hypothetical protein